MKVLPLTLTAVLLLAACSDMRSSAPSIATTPTPTTTPTTTRATPLNGANWVADATVLSFTGVGCGWGLTPGETSTGIWWKITATGPSVILDEDMGNWPTDDVPFSGSLSGTHFTATYAQAPSGPCRFRGGDISGSFSEDGLTFDVVETLTWDSGVPAGRVQRHWTGRRL